MILLDPRRSWYCPNCATTDVTPALTPNRFHNCAGLFGLTAPLLPLGTKAKVTVTEREDYVGAEDVFLHDGRPVMNITTERDDGTDVAVFAPTARLRVQET